MTVEAPKTDATVSQPASPADTVTVTQDDENTTVTIPPPKTPEQMQAEAENKGWIRPKHWFSWQYPWYRLHLISVLNGEDVLDVGIAPLGNDIVVPSPRLGSWIDDFVNAVGRSYAIGMIAAEIAVLVAMKFGPHAFAIALLASVVMKGVMLISAWNSVQALQNAFVGTYISLILGAVGIIKMIDAALLNLASSFLVTASSVDWWKLLYKLIYIPINLVFLILTLNRLNELSGI